MQAFESTRQKHLLLTQCAFHISLVFSNAFSCCMKVIVIHGFGVLFVK